MWIQCLLCLATHYILVCLQYTIVLICVNRVHRDDCSTYVEEEDHSTLCGDKNASHRMNVGNECFIETQRRTFWLCLTQKRTIRFPVDRQTAWLNTL